MLPRPRTSPRKYSEPAATGAAATRGCSRGRARRGRRAGSGSPTRPLTRARRAPRPARRAPRRRPPRGLAEGGAPGGVRRPRGRWSSGRARAGRSRASVRSVDSRPRAGPWPGRPSASARAKKRPSSPLVCSGRSTCGTCPQSVEHDLLGAGQPLLDVALEAGRDQLVVRAPHEHRRRLELGQARVEAAAPERLVEVDVARGGRGRRARARRCGRCARTRRRRRRRARGRPGRGRRTCSRTGLDRAAAEASGAACRTRGAAPARAGANSRRTKATAGHSSAERADALGVLEAELDGDAAAHRVADEVGALDPQRVHRRRARRGRSSGAP